MASQIMRHATAHGETSGVNAVGVNVGDFFHVFHNRFGKGDVIHRTIAGTAGADVPGVPDTCRSNQNKAFPIGYAAVTGGADFAAAIAAQAVEAQNQRHASIRWIAAWYIQVIRAASATYGNSSFPA